MIRSKSRSEWIGGSDTAYVVGNWNTATFEHWMRQKLGLNYDQFQTDATFTGTHLEHKILDAVGVADRDMQIVLPEYGLRVNLDGNSADEIFEVKTSLKEFKISKNYWRQAQAEMFAWKEKFGFVPKLEFISYQVTEEDYRNIFLPIDKDRIKRWPVEYDESFIVKEYLPKVKILHECIQKGCMPHV